MTVKHAITQRGCLEIFGNHVGMNIDFMFRELELRGLSLYVEYINSTYINIQ